MFDLLNPANILLSYWTLSNFYRHSKTLFQG